MEFFEKAHVVKNKLFKCKKLSHNKKKQLKQMLYGYKANDNKLIEKSTNCQNDNLDSTSVSDFFDLNPTYSSCESEEYSTYTVNTTTIDTNKYRENSATCPKSNKVSISSKDSISECDESYGVSYRHSVTSSPTNMTSENNIHNLNDQSVSECSLNTKSFESDDSLSIRHVDENLPDTSSDSDTSIVMSGLNLTESDSSESFDADGKLARKIQQALQIKNKQKSNSKCKKMTQERCESIQPDMEPLPVSEKDVLTDENEASNIDSIMSPSYVSITASDMQVQRLDEVIGDYKYPIIKNILPHHCFQIEENMNVDNPAEDEIDSLIPELDDIPKVEEIDEDIINLDTTIDSIDKSLNTDNITLDSELMNEKMQTLNYDGVTDMFKVYYGSGCCIITLKHPCELFIQGKVKIRCLGGTVEIFGYTLKKETYDVYAPYYNFAQYIKTVENQNIYYGLFAKLTAAGLTVFEAEDIVTTVGEYDGVILLQELKCKIMDFVDNNFRVTNLFLKANKIIEPYFSKAADILNCSLFSSRPIKSFHVHPSWSEAFDLAENKDSRGIVCGGKGAGKSTYLRYQVNKLLAKGPVLVVDLDPGQSEFTVAGNVSATVIESPLFGPSFAHLKKPELTLNIGLIDTMDNVKLYASAVRTLIAYCRNNKAFSSMPWLINTMGMTNAMGLKFITFIIILAQPTFLLQYESKTEKRRFETLLTPPNVRYLFEDYRSDPLFANISPPEDLEYSIVVAYDADGPAKNAYNLLPRDERYLNFLAYFSQLMLTCSAESLLAVTPYEVSIKDLCIATNVIIKKDYITKVINGKMVALCQHARQCDSVRVFTLSDKPLLCRGHGLIRGVDWEKEILYVITPIPSSELSDVDTLLYADWVPELVGLESHLPLGTTVPYRILTPEQHKQLMSTPRRRFNPLQLLKMSRNT